MTLDLKKKSRKSTNKKFWPQFDVLLALRNISHFEESLDADQHASDKAKTYNWDVSYNKCKS